MDNVVYSVEFCEVDPMQTESLACTIVESSPPDPCILYVAAKFRSAIGRAFFVPK